MTSNDTAHPKTASTRFPEQKKEILDAALRVFSQRGYSKATVREIAREANVTTGALYYYYKGKDELLADVMDYAVHYINQLHRHDDTGAPKSQEELLASIEEATAARLKDKKCQQLQMVVASEVATNANADIATHRTRYEDNIERIASFFEPALGADKGDDGYYLAAILVAALDGMAFQSALGMHEDDIDHMADVFNAFFAKGIREY